MIAHHSHHILNGEFFVGFNPQWHTIGWKFIFTIVFYISFCIFSVLFHS